MKKFLTSIIFISFLLLPAISSALELQYPEFGPEGNKITLECHAEGATLVCTDLNKLIAWFYYFIIGIAGLSAFVMLVWGGVEWLTSAGDPSKIGDAKDKINSAIFGLLIILSSWLILQVINPDLTTLSLPILPH